jgi:AcrR family transcriptional regulator
MRIRRYHHLVAEPEVRRRPGPRVGGKDARELLLDSAERLMALHGVDAISLRTITAEAGLTTAALHYHFNSRDDLVNAVLQRRSSGMRAVDGFAELEAGRRPVSARDLVLAICGSTPNCWRRVIRGFSVRW